MDIMINTEFIISKVRKVTNNALIIKYIEDGIKKNSGKLRISVVNQNKCDFGFKNKDGAYFYINIDDSKVYIYNDNLSLREEVIYDKSQDGIKVEYYGNCYILDDSGLLVMKKIDEESFYDSNKKFILSNTHIEHNTYFNGCVMRKFGCTNYDKYIKQCVVDDEIVKIEDIKYHYIPEINSRKCFVSEYRNGMLCSVNEDSFSLPLYSQINDDFSKYELKINSIEKNRTQKQKSML